MTESKVQICNVALGRVGVSQFIDNIDTEKSKPAGICRVNFDTSRDRALREFNWSFARKYAVLKLVDEADGKPWEGDWLYAYRLPADCLFARRIVTYKNDPNPPPFEVGKDDAGPILFTDMAEARLEYTSRVTNVGLFDPLFVSALAWLLAHELALGLSADNKSMRADAMRGYLYDLSRAAAQSANERRRHPDPDTELIRDRM